MPLGRCSFFDTLSGDPAVPNWCMKLTKLLFIKLTKLLFIKVNNSARSSDCYPYKYSRVSYNYVNAKDNCQVVAQRSVQILS